MRTKVPLLILVLLISKTIIAQETMSLGDCIERACKNSYTVQAGLKKIEASQKNYQSAKTAQLPQINSELSSNYSHLSPYSFSQNSAMVTADWSLGDYLFNTSKLAEQNIRIDETDNEQQKLEVSFRTATLYFRILKQQERIIQENQRLELLKSHYAIAQALWQSGTRTQFDVLQTQSEIDQLKESQTLMEMEMQNYQQELAELLDIKTINELKLQPVNNGVIADQFPASITSELSEDIPAVKTIDQQIAAQQLQTKVLTASQLPHLNLSGGVVNDNDPTSDGNYWQMGLSVSAPIFQWHATKYRKEESTALTETLRYQRQEILRNISIITNQLQQKLAKIKEIRQLQQQRLKTAKDTYKIAEINYQAGLMTNLEYLSAQQQLNDTEIAISETELEYANTWVEFYIITNQLDKINNL